MRLLGEGNRTFGLLRFVFFVVCILAIWIGVAPEWYSWYTKPGNCQWMKQLYLFLDGRSWVNIPICLIALICWIPYSTQWTRIGKDIRWLTIAVTLIFLVYWEGGSVVYARIIASFTYRGFITCLLLTPFILSSLEIVIRRFKREAPTEKDTSGGFSNDDFDDSQISDNLKKYASHILDKLIATNTQKHSYALGVTGSWGSGKTTFLEVLKSHVKGRAEIVIFNPWMCRTPEQVTLDFFASLRHQLSPSYRISKSIKDYARALNGISLTPFLGLSLNIHAVQGDSLYVKKKKLSDKLAELPKPVLVFIDDLDRLEREEVFEVLRLIRNTADLSNLIYVVAYDKAYVRQVLEQKNIGNALGYLEKIFPIEVCLPKVEKYLIWGVLHSDIDAQACSDEFAKQLFQDFNTDDVELVLRILSTYRRAKRFARIYMLNATYVNQELRLEINQVDLFWLILLQVYDPKIYEILIHNRFKLLYKYIDRLILRDGIIAEVKKQEGSNYMMYDGERFWELETPQILNQVFGRKTKTVRSKKCVCFIENYDKYFALSIPEYKLAISELESLLEGSDSPESIVRDWVETKSIQSIYLGLGNIDTKNFRGVYLTRFLRAVLELGVTEPEADYEISPMLDQKRYSTPQSAPREIVWHWLTKEIESGNEIRLEKVTLLLNGLYVTQVYDAKGNIEHPYHLIISNEDIQTLLAKAMEQFLGDHPNLTALDILDEKRILGRLFKNCCVKRIGRSFDDETFEFVQSSFSPVIKHFSSKDMKPSLSEYQEAYDRMFRVHNPQFNNFKSEDPRTEYEDRKQMEDQFAMLHYSYFGTNEDLIARFKSECFSQDEQAVGSSPSGSETALTQEGQD